jgi:phosphopantetheinyl transferase
MIRRAAADYLKRDGAPAAESGLDLLQNRAAARNADRDTVRAAAREISTDGAREAVILRTDKGKPFFRDLPLEFSVTHSGNTWMCMVSRQPCGIDFQLIKSCSYLRIAERFFSEPEYRYVKERGETAFFRLWTKREAFGKLTGGGFFDSGAVNFLPEWIRTKRGEAVVKLLDVGPGACCAYAAPADVPVELISL